ncbi:aldehyde dehydrogenase [Mycena metata]|uniref:Aldehyde dehydrogenase n=1 Tax=Mycena metata TaxID=1033252 RepID=A0AAD7MI35_9AGAR|nr:aldehyde dehydrogenase [Mycena metata]
MQFTPTPTSELPGIRETLRATFKAGTPQSIEWRRHQLHQLARMAIAQDVGKPKVETYFAEIGPIVQRCLLNAEKLEEWTSPVNVVVPDWQKSWSPTIYKGGKGTVLIIAPWNYPMILSLQPLLGAIAAGCCAVIKPSEIAPHYSTLLSELAPKYLESSAFRVVLGGVSETTKLLELQWDHIFYTGNSRVARIIARAAAQHLSPLTLELGGKCPVIIDPAYDLKLAARRTLWGKAQNCGQVCVAPDYVLIPRQSQDAFISALKEAYAEFFPAGSLSSKSISRIVSPEHHARIMDLLERTQGQVVFGGASSFQDLRIELTVVRDVGVYLWNELDMLFPSSEIFGPILAVVPVDTVQQAIELVRDSKYPLVLYAFTESDTLKSEIVKGTLSGNVVFNDTFQQLAGSTKLPLGGVGESGYGRQIFKYTFDEFSYERASIDMPKQHRSVDTRCADVCRAGSAQPVSTNPLNAVSAEPFLTVRYPPYTEENFGVMAATAFLDIPKGL